MPIQYKTNEDGSVQTNEKGHIIVYDPNAPERGEWGLDSLHLHSKVPELQNEAKEYREAKENLEKKLKVYTDALGDDPTPALEALEKIKTFEEKEMVESGELEKLKSTLAEVEEQKRNELRTNLESVIAEKDQLINSQRDDIYKAMVSTQFSRCPYFAGPEPKTILPPEIAESYFKKHFKVEKVDGVTRVVGYLGDKKIYSKEKYGELAEFDECISAIIDDYHAKDAIMQPSIGSGAAGGRGKSVRNSDLKKLAELKPAERLKAYHRKKAM